MTVQNPHDHFFRESFSRREIVEEFIKQELPAEISQTLNLESLNPVPSSFIDPELSEYQSDLLYHVETANGEPLSLYLLFEHKSYLDQEVAFQLLRYIVKIWEKQQRDDKQLAPILPIVIYHGAKAWTIPTDFHGFFKPGEMLARFTPQFNYLLKDISHLNDEEIRGGIWYRVTLSVLRAIFSPTFREELPDLIKLMWQLQEYESGLEYLRTILYYVTRTSDRSERQIIIDTVKAQGTTGDQLMTTIYQEILEEGIEQGIEQGIEKGIEQGKAELILRLLKKYDPQTVSQMTELSLETILDVEKDHNSK